MNETQKQSSELRTNYNCRVEILKVQRIIRVGKNYYSKISGYKNNFDLGFKCFNVSKHNMYHIQSFFNTTTIVL